MHIINLCTQYRNLFLNLKSNEQNKFCFVNREQFHKEKYFFISSPIIFLGVRFGSGSVNFNLKLRQCSHIVCVPYFVLYISSYSWPGKNNKQVLLILDDNLMKSH